MNSEAQFAAWCNMTFGAATGQQVFARYSQAFDPDPADPESWGYQNVADQVGSVAMSLCITAYPVYTKFTKIIGTSVSETTMRPNPTTRSSATS